MKAATKIASGVLGLLLLTAGAARAAEAPGCRLEQVGELPVKFEHNRPLVPVSINGKPGWFLIDTGAASSTIFGGAATSYGLNLFTAPGVKFFGVGGGQEARFAVVSDFALASVKVKNLRLYVIGARGSAEQAGLLGRDFLGQFDLEFDLADKVLRLWRPPHCGMQYLAYWSKTAQVADLHQDDPNAPYRIKVLVNGKSIDAMLDSGATTTVVTPDVASTAGVRKQDFAAHSHFSTGIGDHKVQTRIATFDTVTVGEEEIKHARLEVADLYADDTVEETGSILKQKVQIKDLTPMLIGADFLRSHRVFLVPSQHVLYFTYSGGPVFQVFGEAVKPKDETPDSSVPPPSPMPPSAPPPGK